jgi:hypothetical protein
MTPAARAGGTAFAAAFSLCACVASPISADAPKTVRGHWLPPYGSHEECLRLEPGDRAEFAFESTDPVEFNVHYHDGQAVVMPLVREKSRGDAGMFAPPLGEDYCLTWEAGPAGALLDFRVRLRRAGP